jgi:hypothetical protein
VSPTIFRSGGFRFFFFSREESRMHIHVYHAGGEAKFWIEPVVELAQNHGLSPRHIRTAKVLIWRHEDEIREAWNAHFGR